MAHFAQIGLNSKVISVTRIDDSIITDDEGNENEQLGIEYLANMTGWAIWKRTWKDGSQRGLFAGKGFVYNEDYDVFLPPKPFISWIFDNVQKRWKAPVDYPTDGLYYIWNESEQRWINAEIPPNGY